MRKGYPTSGDASADDPSRQEADARRLLHELEVHQIELKGQNDELRLARTELERGLLDTSAS